MDYQPDWFGQQSNAASLSWTKKCISRRRFSESFDFSLSTLLSGFIHFSVHPFSLSSSHFMSSFVQFYLHIPEQYSVLFFSFFFSYFQTTFPSVIFHWLFPQVFQVAWLKHAPLFVWGKLTSFLFSVLFGALSNLTFVTLGECLLFGCTKQTEWALRRSAFYCRQRSF